MDPLLLYASGLILHQTLLTLEQKRAIPHLRQLVEDIRWYSETLLVVNGVKIR
jgi:hypothetical protein